VAISIHNPTCKQLLTAGVWVLGYPGIMLVVITMVIALLLDLVT